MRENVPFGRFGVELEVRAISYGVGVEIVSHELRTFPCTYVCMYNMYIFDFSVVESFSPFYIFSILLLYICIMC